MGEYIYEAPFRSAFEFAVFVSSLCGKASTQKQGSGCDCTETTPCSRTTPFTRNDSQITEKNMRSETEMLSKPLSDYAHHLAAHLFCSGASFVTAYVLCGRLHQRQPELFCPRTAHKIMASCVIVAVKFTEDKYFANRRYADVCLLALPVLNLIERSLLGALDFTIFVHPTEHQLAHQSMRRLCIELNLSPPLALLQPPVPMPSLPSLPFGSSRKRKAPISPCDAPDAKLAKSGGRRRWTADEDAQLLRLVQDLGKQWTAIAARMEGRDARSCSQRWSSHVNPELKNVPFSSEEDAQLIRLVDELGTKWTQISQRMCGRSNVKLSARYAWLVKNNRTCPVSSPFAQPQHQPIHLQPPPQPQPQPQQQPLALRVAHITEGPDVQFVDLTSASCELPAIGASLPPALASFAMPPRSESIPLSDSESANTVRSGAESTTSVVMWTPSSAHPKLPPLAVLTSTSTMTDIHAIIHPAC